MRERTNIQLSATDRNDWRAKIVLLTADGHGTAEIIRATGKAKTVIWRWQERFGEEGVAGLWRSAVALPRSAPQRVRPPLGSAAENARASACRASHWTGAAMAKAAGIVEARDGRPRAYELRPA